MIIWLIFVMVVLLLSFLHNNRNNKLISFIIIFVLTYFSTFRDGLGTDYSGYLQKLDYLLQMSLDNVYVLFDEPLLLPFAQLIDRTFISEILFFGIFAFVINCLFVKSFVRYEYFFYIMAAYILIPSIFYNTFNVTRQFFCAAIFLYCLKYLEDGKPFKYVICVLIASMIHVSAILLFIAIPLRKIKINRGLGLTLQVGSIFLGSVLIKIVVMIIQKTGFYMHYLDSGGEDEIFGGFFIFVNVLLFFVSFFKNRIRFDNRYDDVYKYSIVFICIFNLSLSFSILYRLSLYFIIFPFILFPKLGELFSHGKSFFRTVLLSVYALFFILLLSSNSSIVIPSKVLSPLSIMDDNYIYDKLRYINR